MSQRAPQPGKDFSDSYQASARRGAWLTGLCFVGALTTWACGSDTENGGAGGVGGGGAVSSSSKASATRASSASGNATVTASQQASSTAAGPGCSPPVTAPSMGMCVTLTSGSGGGTTTAATTATTAAATTASTSDASSSADATTTAAATTAAATTAASGSSGTGMAEPLIECNPVTNEPCEADAACDSNQNGGFSCFAPPNEQGICEECDVANGPWCQGGGTCAVDSCWRFCCEDSDCGDVGCVKEDTEGAPLFPIAPGLGLCVPPQ